MLAYIYCIQAPLKFKHQPSAHNNECTLKCHIPSRSHLGVTWNYDNGLRAPSFKWVQLCRRCGYANMVLMCDSLMCDPFHLDTQSTNTEDPLPAVPLCTPLPAGYPSLVSLPSHTHKYQITSKPGCHVAITTTLQHPMQPYTTC